MRNAVLIALLLLGGCTKYGMTGCANKAMGDWVEAYPPSGCHVKQIAAEHDSGVVILCEDGRVYR